MKIQQAVDAVMHSFGHETAHLEHSEQIEAAAGIIAAIATTMSDIYADGIIEIHRDAQQRYALETEGNDGR